jgi:hypothetical protein
VFWADTTSKKNYVHFGDVLSFDTTYSTNQYDMKFAPFTGVNRHMRSIFFGAAFLADEKIESYVWLFHTFLRAMGGKAPTLIVADEDVSMRVAISIVLPDMKHRLCMWHIMKNLPEKIDAHLLQDDEFDAHLLQDDEFRKMTNSCVWGSESIEEFESRWQAWITKYRLDNNEWLNGRYHIHKSWISAYFSNIWLAGILQTTSRSESANSFLTGL